jgi:hypothetical protein
MTQNRLKNAFRRPKKFDDQIQLSEIESNDSAFTSNDFNKEIKPL